jgi:staphylococcal nuclease domain-containing protein 1
MVRGLVLAVISGDTLVVKMIDSGNTINAVCLEFIQAPRLGSPDGRTEDEPGAWQSFEYVRKLALGQRVIIDQSRKQADLKRSHPSFGPLPLVFGRVSLFDQQSEDVGSSIIENGWARVRTNQKSEDDYQITLLQLQDAATDGKLGVWGEKLLVRKLPVAFEERDLLQRKDFDALIDSVLNGSTFNVSLLPNFESATIQLAGVRCPSAKRGAPELFGMEAKSFVESRLLQRTVKISLLSVNEKGIFVGRVVHPRGDIAVLLLSEGLGQMNNQTAVQLPNSEELRAAENRAKEGRKNLWKNFDVTSLRTSRVNGRVLSIKGSSSVEVDEGLEVVRLWLSGCKVPNFNPSAGSEPFGFEAREKLRSMLIGRAVQCVIDYKVEDRRYATIYVGNSCINEELIAAGLASAVIARNQNASDRIDSMIRAEAEAKKSRIGIHSGSTVNAQLNDLSNKHSRQRSVPFLHYIQGKRNIGVIEHFVSASRVVVLIPDHRCIIRLNLQGLCQIDPKERIGHEALTYCQNNFLQRSVAIHVFSVDKVGCFVGNIFLIDGKKDASIEAAILAHGFTSVHHASIVKCPARAEMEAAEAKASEEKLGVWNSRVRGMKVLEPQKHYEVTVVDIWDPVTVSIQIQSEEFRRINAGLIQAKTPAGKVMKGDFVAAIYDKKVYRAKVLQVLSDNDISVEFLELNIHDNVPVTDLRVLPEELLSIPPQAIAVRLGGLKAFTFDEEFNNRAMEYVWGLVEGATLYANLMYDDDLPAVLLTDRPEGGGSVNSMLLSEGMARIYAIDLEPPYQSVMEEFCSTEADAKASRKGAWVHGDIGEDDDDEVYD